MCFKFHVGYVHILDLDVCNLNVQPINLYAHVIFKKLYDAPPSSLIDLIANLRWKQWKDKELGYAP
jgi:hypothetical protein